MELQDRAYDRPPPGLDPADLEQVPPPWLRSGSSGSGDELPHLRRAGEELAAESPDALFEFAVDVLLEGLARRALG